MYVLKSIPKSLMTVFVSTVHIMFYHPIYKGADSFHFSIAGGSEGKSKLTFRKVFYRPSASTGQRFCKSSKSCIK